MTVLLVTWIPGYPFFAGMNSNAMDKPGHALDCIDAK